jgi:hypothetical protein
MAKHLMLSFTNEVPQELGGSLLSDSGDHQSANSGLKVGTNQSPETLDQEQGHLVYEGELTYISGHCHNRKKSSVEK